MSTDRQMDTEVVHITVKHYLAIKKNEMLPFVTTWMDQESIILSEICQKKKNIMIALM